MTKQQKEIIDKLGIFTSGLCAVHCAFLPILLSVGMFTSVGSDFHHLSELIVVLTSMLLGIGSVYNGLKGHGRLMPQVLIGSGALIIIIGLLSSGVTHLIMAFGGFILLLGHWLNWRKLKLQ